MGSLKIETFAEGLAFPEGPVVMDDGSVIVTEVLGGKVTRCWGGGRKEVVSHSGGGPNGLAIGADGALYLCNNGGLDIEKQGYASGPGSEGRIERIDIASGKVERLHDRCDGEPLSAPNDIVVDARGDLWFSDLGKFDDKGHARSWLYHARADGSSIRRVNAGYGGYNGVGLSPDGKTVYAAETMSARLFAFDTDPAVPNGNPRLVGTAPGMVYLDSLAVTAAGNICVAQLLVGAIVTFNPQDGSVVATPMPDEHTTNIAFGGPDMTTAFITQSSSGTIIRAPWREQGLRLNFNA